MKMFPFLLLYCLAHPHKGQLCIEFPSICNLSFKRVFLNLSWDYKLVKEKATLKSVLPKQIFNHMYASVLPRRQSQCFSYREKDTSFTDKNLHDTCFQKLTVSFFLPHHCFAFLIHSYCHLLGQVESVTK